jgi:hypothetical protein
MFKSKPFEEFRMFKYAWFAGVFLVLFTQVSRSDQPAPLLSVSQNDDYVEVKTDLLEARIRKKGYVSGVAQGTFLDKKTGAKDLGFGLHIMDFLLAPGWKDDAYLRDAKLHGDLPKHYIEGPQICTNAKELKPEIVKGRDFIGVRLRTKFTEAANGFKAGSLWEQTLVFLPGVRYFLCGEQITSVNDVNNVFYRLDMPGHIRHKNGDTFSQVYLSYQGKIPAEAFKEDFAPDSKYLYQRKEGKIPERMIRAYQIKDNDKLGPWLAGMTLDPAQVYEAWCHQRGYVCFIEELHGRKVKAGDTFGTAYIIGYFDDIPAMEGVYDRFKGKRTLSVSNKGYELK